jgi:response regulator RpfG family c-di-GMP phosphodiesterase
MSSIISNFFPARLDDLTLNSNVNFDVFIYFKINNKMVQIFKDGDFFGQDNFNNLTNKKLKHIFIQKSQRQLFCNYKTAIFAQAINSKDLDIEKKKEILQQHTVRAIKSLSEVTNKEDSAQIMENCNDITKNIIANVANKGFAKTYDEIAKMVKGGTGLMVHSANVSSMSVLFAMLCDVTSPTDLEDLAMGGLLHDMGLSAMNPSVAEKYLAGQKMSEAEESEYRDHPAKTNELLKSRSKSIHQNVIDIVMQHHENFDGSGFPRHIKNMQINFLAKLVRLANDFDITYRRLVEEEKFDQLPKIFIYMAEGKILDGKFKDEHQVDGKSIEAYDRKIVTRLRDYFSPEVLEVDGKKSA